MSTETILTPEEIEKDRQKWLKLINELNEVSSIRYTIRKSDHDGYWYITPEPTPKETIHLDDIKKEKSQDWTVRFSQKQFGTEYSSWIKNPESNFILDMIPQNSKDPDQYAGRFSYHPLQNELLLAILLSNHAQTIRQFGNFPFNEYQRGIYIKDKKIVLIRPYFNPLDKYGTFNETHPLFDEQLNELVTNTTLEMLLNNGLPIGTKIIKNATNQIISKYTESHIN